MKLHIVTGFLGSGKTTAIRQAARLLLREKTTVSVITNDQGSRLVDGGWFESLGIPGRQVGGGCFCCNYDELEQNIRILSDTEHSSVIFAEAVGSCTDMISTVLKPLQQFHPDTPVTVTTFTDVRLLRMMLDGNHSFDDPVAYIYQKQLEESEIIIVNKKDLVDDQFLDEISKKLSEQYQGKFILFQNSADDTDILRWLSVLDGFRRKQPTASLAVDYDIYAAGEAKMAWYDQHLEIYTPNNNSLQITEQVINSLYGAILRLQVPIGHLKFLVNGITKISFIDRDEKPAKLDLQPASSSSLLINIRVQESAGVIHRLADEVLAQFSERCKLIASKAEVFSPGYPKPTHRM